MKTLQEEQMYHHFSHHHQLVRTAVSISTSNITCSGCKLSVLTTKGYYTCKSCPFYLHQVCYNMPKKTRHPSHPNHLLTLHVMSSSSDETFKCEACGHRVNGFYYKCADCSICYHILCSALPLSVSITSHLHTLKLEFSPPCDLQCDVCKKMAYNGWLYRCQICEFDAHLACAVSNQITQSFRHPTAPLTKQREDYINEGNELMQLVSLGVTRNISENIATISSSPIPQESDHSSLLSSDLSVAHSYQFSDGCFSIDLAGSYSSFDHKLSGTTPLSKVKETTIEKNKIMLDRITSNFEPKKQETIYVKKESFDSRMSEAFLTRNGTHSDEQRNRKKTSNESKSMSGVGDQSKKSEKGRSDCSCWPSLFQS